ncbi:helix-turn-helix transcriptional regulator [Halalkalicoccus jeotgali]|uniref:PadR like DNA binding protein n=1 Tax=Halalkalicoccus jeotgali (strain DSM 18796 / CECT 7217 / JCM 14584 / KCTC 4019 / B3) TaxID=795797 RepID=D8JB12_HALJB|nr:helix-turn-helix transcriptional regulator [Halalkalicoccus jeotgali]ADJ16465.1 padR like DNA binding protein [Halalkalicoccus jeotgali B3]ELY41440.1 padR like DNA binding protein [Halalkalicoccus jeotgali B3]
MNKLTSFQRDSLWIIAGLSKPNGVTIKDELEAYYDTAIQAGRLYPNLDTLVNKGLARKDKVDGRTNAYILTDHGHRALDARCKWIETYLNGIADE